MSMIFSSGIYFLLADATELINESGKITYMLYLKSGTNIAELHKFIRMFAIPYRMVLIDEGHAEQTSVSLRAKLAEAQRKQGGRTKKKNGAKEERYNPIKPNGYYDFSDNTFCLR